MTRTSGLRGAILALGAVGLIALGAVTITGPWSSEPPCPAQDHAEWTVARRWDEALLDAIRRALPAPTVHARNLYHASAAMWDAWAAYDPDASGVYVTEKASAPDTNAARDEAISYAAYRLLTARYISSVGGDESLSEFADLMDALCYPLDLTTTTGDRPAALGNRIAATIIEATREDGSNEAGGYAADDYRPINPPLTVAGSDVVVSDPN